MTIPKSPPKAAPGLRRKRLPAAAGAAAQVATATPAAPAGESIQLFGTSFQAETVGIAEARVEMPRMVRDSQLGRVFLIRNTRNARDEGALLVNPSVLQRVVERGNADETLGDILRALPFGGVALPLRPGPALPDDVAPRVVLPG